MEVFARVAADHIMRTARIVCRNREYECAVNILVAWNDNIISTVFAEHILSDLFRRADPTLCEDLHAYMAYFKKAECDQL